MNLLQALILSAVEGITEFLPVSSTGHLILTAYILQIPQTGFVKSFEIFIQLGAILSILFLYFQRICHDRKIWRLIGMALLPTLIGGFGLYPVIKNVLLGNPAVVLWALFTGGILIIILEKILPPKKLQISDLSLKQALTIGLFQTVSLIPGVSRAAATIFGGLITGLQRREAVEFSFLLALPTMIMAVGLDVVKSSFNFTPSEWWIMFAGFGGAFITALLTVKLFLKFVGGRSLIGFGIYRIILAGVFLTILF